MSPYQSMPGHLIPMIAVQKPGDKSVIPRISGRRGHADVRAHFAGRNRKDGSAERFIALGSLILDTISVGPTMARVGFSLSDCSTAQMFS